uniref:Uncharacterized protein n=1 Tax=Peronospora matthiolae TaxID=2874970 RepID=A0AAV1U853_9STRA
MASYDHDPSENLVTRSHKTRPRSRAVKKQEKKQKKRIEAGDVTMEEKKLLLRRRASSRNVRELHEDRDGEETRDRDEDEDRKGDGSQELSGEEEEEEEEEEEVENEEGEQEEDREEQEDEKDEVTVLLEQEQRSVADDTVLRRTYLQRIYRQLQSTHPEQDDTVIRQLATSIEVQACQKVKTRDAYVAAMDQEIHKLLQIEIAQANSAVVYSGEGQRFENVHHDTRTQQSGMPSGIQSSYLSNQTSQACSFEYVQALAKVRSQESCGSDGSSAFPVPGQTSGDSFLAFYAPHPSVSAENSFQSLMNDQTESCGRSDLRTPLQHQQLNTISRGMNMRNHRQLRTQCNPTTSMVSPSSQNFSVQSNVGNPPRQALSQSDRKAQQQLEGFPKHPQYMQRPDSTRTQQRFASFQEFSAQIQHLDKSVLIELLWNQRNALARWQRHAKQLNVQLFAQQNAVGSAGGSVFHSPYKVPVVGGGSYFDPKVPADAELRQYRQENISRRPQFSCPPQSSEGSSARMQAAVGGVNRRDIVQVYWDKVQALKTAHTEHLHIAKRALVNNCAPPNTLYSVKAQSVMNNIDLVIDILHEQSTNVLPRKMDVLTSIERFIQITVVPIVRKVRSSFIAPTSQPTSSLPVMGTSSATENSGMLPARDSPVGITGQQTDCTHHAGSGWSPDTFSSLRNLSRQSSRETCSDSTETDSFSGRPGDDCPNTPTRMMDGFSAAVGNSPSGSVSAISGYAPVRPESKDAIAMQAKTSTDQVSEFKARRVQQEQFLPTSELRLPTDSDLRPPSSPGGNTKESKELQTNVDDLNDFADFPELTFDEDGSSFARENNPSTVSRKRGIEEV